MTVRDFTDNGAEFPDHDFFPAYTPEKMLELGVFGGVYLSKATRDDLKGLSPAVKAIARQQMGVRPDPGLNAFGVHSGLSLKKWQDKGWIRVDSLGWFHWYCRFCHGRRFEKLDEWQIGRWRRYAERKWPEIKRRDHREGRLSRIERQGLLHWSHNPFMVNAE